MNRQERRAREAQTRKSFAEYSDTYRKAFRQVDEREIGEGWMRGAAAEAKGFSHIIVHPPGEAPPPFDQCDITLSTSYGPQHFRAVTTVKTLDFMQAEWLRAVKVIGKLPKTPVTDDPRNDARGFIFEIMMDNKHYADDGGMGALAACAMVWLVKTSPAGVMFGDYHKCAHYEVTDTGPTGRNFRLILS